MKLSKIIILSLGVVFMSFLYLSCTKNNKQLATTDSDFSNSTTVQVFNAAVKSTRNYVYVDGVPVSGAALAFGGVFPATAYAFKVNGGLRAFLIKDTLNTSTQPPLTFAENMLIGRSYTIFTYDTFSIIKQITVLNNITVPTDTTSRLRFANFIYNSTTSTNPSPAAVPNVDVYSYRRIPGTPSYPGAQTFPNFTGITPVFSNVPTYQVTDFIPYASGITDSLYVFATGTTTPLITKSVVTTLTPQRSYTSVYTGSFKGTKTFSTIVTY
jgi:hypothetical protein